MGVLTKKSACFLIHLGQDLDLLLPIMTVLRRQGVHSRCLIYKKLLPKSPRIVQKLTDLQIEWHAIDPYKDAVKASWLIAKSTITMTAVETTANAHRFGHTYTKVANRLFKRTFTLQHGLENIGLTYEDAEYPVKDIKFASRQILLWSTPDRLLPGTEDDTKSKCVSFGCTKNFSSSSPLEKPGDFVVSAFENLHWNRYDDTYKNSFIADFIHSAESRPDISFIIKPHHAGQWLTDRSKKKYLFPNNVLVIDPKNPAYEPYTGPDFIGLSDIVITTPSSIAFDAAMMNKPVFVTSYNLNLSDRYSPLPLIHSRASYLQLIDDARKNPQTFLDKSSQFAKVNNVNPDCLEKIYDRLFHNNM